MSGQTTRSTPERSISESSTEKSDPGLERDLRDRVSGKVTFDRYTRLLYATDGSIYRAEPAGVVFPEDTDDVREAIDVAAEHDVPILPRGAGSSLAGQAVGSGCIVLDLSRHMNDIVSIRPDERRVVVQPGVVQDDLDEHLSQYGLKFAPDPASSNRATVGGGIGNNSTGAHSVRYGITDAYTESVHAILSDGTMIHAREIVLDSPEWNRMMERNDREAELHRTVRRIVDEHEEAINNRYPDLKRRVTGYNLDRVIYENEDGDRVMNLAKLFVGAEGTLGVVVEAELSLVTVPEETALVLYCFDDLTDAMKAVPVALDYDVSAVELMDDEVFRLAAQSDGYAQYVEPIPDDAAAALMLEYDSECHDDLTEAIASTNQRFVQQGQAFDVIEAHSDHDQTDLWNLRKAAIPLLMSLEGDPKPYPFIEDATVPPDELAEYVQQFESILDEHGTSAAYFAHAGSGTLHIRPILNLKSQRDIDVMHSIADDVTDLVLEHHGSFSGEHGDGRARTEFTPKMYGPDLWEAFKSVKTAFDPSWRMHPGNVVYRDGPDDPGPDSHRGVGADMRSNLRYGPEYQSLEPRTSLDFDGEGGFSQLVELCNGCGTCRQSGENVMCPTYRASREEIQATRGRANLLREAIGGELPEDEIYSERFQQEVLDLCVGCKGCKNDCPTGVDLAKLKAEVKHQYHDRTGTGWREWLFAHVDRMARFGSAFAPLSNWLTNLPGTRSLLQQLLGIAPERSLPSFQSESFRDWFIERGGSRVSGAEARQTVLLFPDTYTNYANPSIGQATVRVLEEAGIRVLMPEEFAPSGRASYSTGLLDVARKRARQNVEVLQSHEHDLICMEPSDAVMFQDEYGDLLDDASAREARTRTFGLFEYIDAHGLHDEVNVNPDQQGIPTSLTYHGHCHQKATGKAAHTARVLRRLGFEVDVLDSSCCGMAGSFGYHDEHFDLSKSIGRLLRDKVSQSNGQQVIAPGTSCRTQMSDWDENEVDPLHPIEVLDQVLAES